MSPIRCTFAALFALTVAGCTAKTSEPVAMDEPVMRVPVVGWIDATATLAAGRSYTVQVSGVNGTTGEALVEIYELP